MRIHAAVLVAVLLLAPQAVAQRVTPPAEHLARPLGGDFTLADWNEVAGYFRKLADQSSRVLTTRVGTSTEGREFLLSIISSESNLARLDEIKAHARTLHDPRNRTDAQKRDAVENGRVVLFISPAMHSTETAGPQFAMEFAYLLATSDDEPWRSAREQMVIGILPCTNPDGVDHVVDWYRRTVATPHEAADLLRLYQLYAGHDNNRDWFMLSLEETRIVTRLLYHEWFPTVYWDVHQQGSGGERLFVPPFRDPLNPNLDPGIISGINLIGVRSVLDMTREGLTGIATGVSYDMWWNGGNRNVPVRHNVIGLLTEAASVRLATPIFQPVSTLSHPVGPGAYGPSNQFVNPWPGGWWRIRDIIDYEIAFARSLLGTLSREPALWRRNQLEAAERAIARGRDEAPRAWIIPSDNRDPAAVRRLADSLLLAAVDLHVASASFLADGQEYPAGSIVIRADQPYRTHVKDLLEVQRFPEGAPPYDVSGWTLPFILGVHRVEATEAVSTALKPVKTPDEAVAAFKGDPRAREGALSSWHSDAWTRLAAALKDGREFAWITSGPDAGLLWPRPKGAAPAKEPAGVAIRALPRLGLYAPWSGSMDEGWTRWVLDHQKVPYASVRNERLRAGRLRDSFDVLLIPSMGPDTLDRGRSEGSVPSDYAGGLDPEGAVAIEEFVRAGGTLVTFGASNRWAIDLFRIPVVDVTRESDGREFNCPGGVLRAIPESVPLTAGLPDSVALFFSRGSAYREMTSDERKKAGVPEGARAETLLRYAPTRVLLSGWIRKPEVIQDRAAWVRFSHGEGRVHLFGFQPQYRSWAQGTFQLLHRASFLDSRPR